MSLRLSLLSSVLLLALLSAGCVLHGGHAYGPCPPARKTIVVGAGHVHGPHCGHFLHGSSWVHAPGHVHGAWCGHVLVGKVWVSK